MTTSTGHRPVKTKALVTILADLMADFNPIVLIHETYFYFLLTFAYIGMLHIIIIVYII